MKKIILSVSMLALSAVAFSQDKTVKNIKSSVTAMQIEAQISFLAADEMRGRDTGSPEIAIAANYLVNQYKMAGLKMVPGMTSYFQEVGLQKVLAPKTLDVKLDDDFFKGNTDLVLAGGKSLAYTGDFIFVGYGNEADLKAADIKGKIIVCYAGSSEKSDWRTALMTESQSKHKQAIDKGVAGVIEILNFPDLPWQRIAGYFAGSKIGLAGPDEQADKIPHLLLRNTTNPGLTKLIHDKKLTGTLVVDVPEPKKIDGKNVIGLIEGTDPKLKDEYIVLSAHYDHIGVRNNGTPDSIYNGARDNGIGTSSILQAAAFLSKNPVKRSILVIAYTGEEKGLLGSKWYSEHPAVPLNKTVYNLDCDGAGYNDKSIVTLIDLNRTNVDDLLKKASSAFGLRLAGDPVPEEHLYERSDNYNFAVKGVPAVDISPGVKGFDDELIKYYHQAADEASSLDYAYLEKFAQTYVYAAVLVGNSPVKTYWKAGDKFEEAGKKLYETH